MNTQSKDKVIIGIDPGSITTGYGLIQLIGRDIRFIACGCIRTGGDKLPLRLQVIFQDLQELNSQYLPNEMAIENVFMARNPDSALKLGQARGAAICAMTSNHIPVYEYTANQVKLSVVGMGHANKKQVQHMVKMLLSLSEPPQADAADALAVAICHANTQKTLNAFQAQTSKSYSNEVLQAIKGRRKKRFTLS